MSVHHTKIKSNYENLSGINVLGEQLFYLHVYVDKIYDIYYARLIENISQRAIKFQHDRQLIILLYAVFVIFKIFTFRSHFYMFAYVDLIILSSIFIFFVLYVTPLHLYMKKYEYVYLELLEICFSND